MSFENPENIIRSWNVQTGFATGPVVKDALVPQKFGRIRTNFICTWREEKLNTVLDFGQSNFSIYLPESLRVLKECYLKIEVPQAPSALKAYPGLYFIKSMRLLSAGQEVYVCDYFQHMVDHGARIQTAPVDGWYDCGRIETLLATNHHLLETTRGGIASDASLEEATFEGMIRVEENARICASILGPNVTVERGATIEEATLRDCIVGENAVVQGCNLHDSILGAESRIENVIGRLNAGPYTELLGRG